MFEEKAYNAIQNLFGDRDFFGNFLIYRNKKQNVLGLSQLKPLGQDIAWGKRISYYKRRLVERIILRGDQCLEFPHGDEEIVRLQHDAEGTILALRDINFAFPEIEIADDKLYDEIKNLMN